MQTDARRADVAGARPVRVPDVRQAVSGLLATTFARHFARAGTAGRNAVSERFGHRDRTGYPNLRKQLRLTLAVGLLGIR